HDRARIARVGKRGHPRAQSFLDSVTRRVEQGVRIEHVASRGGETEDPAAKVEGLEEAAHRGELEVRVRVDGTGKQKDVAEVMVVARWRLFDWTDEGDASTVHRDDTVAHRLGGDGHDPARAVSDHAGKDMSFREVRPMFDPCQSRDCSMS